MATSQPRTGGRMQNMVNRLANMVPSLPRRRPRPTPPVERPVGLFDDLDDDTFFGLTRQDLLNRERQFAGRRERRHNPLEADAPRRMWASRNLAWNTWDDLDTPQESEHEELGENTAARRASSSSSAARPAEKVVNPPDFKRARQERQCVMDVMFHGAKGEACVSEYLDAKSLGKLMNARRAPMQFVPAQKKPTERVDEPERQRETNVSKEGKWDVIHGKQRTGDRHRALYDIVVPEGATKLTATGTYKDQGWGNHDRGYVSLVKNRGEGRPSWHPKEPWLEKGLVDSTDLPAGEYPETFFFDWTVEPKTVYEIGGTAGAGGGHEIKLKDVEFKAAVPRQWEMDPEPATV